MIGSTECSKTLHNFFKTTMKPSYKYCINLDKIFKLYEPRSEDLKNIRMGPAATGIVPAKVENLKCVNLSLTSVHLLECCSKINIFH